MFLFLEILLLGFEMAPTLKEFGVEMVVRIQGGRGGFHTRQAHNMNFLLGLGQNDDGVNKIQVTTETVAYSSVNDDGTRQPLSFCPEDVARCAEQGRVESYINRHQDVMLSNEVRMDFSGCTMIEVIIIIGKFNFFILIMISTFPQQCLLGAGYIWFLVTIRCPWYTCENSTTPITGPDANVADEKFENDLVQAANRVFTQANVPIGNSRLRKFLFILCIVYPFQTTISIYSLFS